MLATDINTALSLKQDSLVTLTPAPSAGQFLSYNGTILLWENAPTTDLSNYYTKSETQGVVDQTVNDFYNDVLLADFYDKTVVDGLLDGKQNALTPLVPDPTGSAYVLYWDSFDQSIKWTTEPGFLITVQTFND